MYIKVYYDYLDGNTRWYRLELWSEYGDGDKLIKTRVLPESKVFSEFVEKEL